ncbi:acyl carrier protein [Fictibacillus sp. KIGAM418]|uniref:Acyl carrier protein n=1 Tax=Fictibacillus marinisediminis TaxID=2878389 RepID=A0A9X1XG02_9BACL|nr:acyl carrier protein [Fictibacillus marinisediminis]MCK6259456.1 acyl carrier protein [Fictibacillus marinisediminis]
MNITNELFELMSQRHCGVLPLEDIHENLTMFEAGFDSLRFMELVVLIEEHFSIEFPDDLLDITSTTTIGDIALRINQQV